MHLDVIYSVKKDCIQFLIGWGENKVLFARIPIIHDDSDQHFSLGKGVNKNFDPPYSLGD